MRKLTHSLEWEPAHHRTWMPSWPAGFALSAVHRSRERTPFQVFGLEEAHGGGAVHLGKGCLQTHHSEAHLPPPPSGAPWGVPWGVGTPAGLPLPPSWPLLLWFSGSSHYSVLSTLQLLCNQLSTLLPSFKTQSVPLHGCEVPHTLRVRCRQQKGYHSAEHCGYPLIQVLFASVTKAVKPAHLTWIPYTRWFYTTPYTHAPHEVSELFYTSATLYLLTYCFWNALCNWFFRQDPE